MTIINIFLNFEFKKMRKIIKFPSNFKRGRIRSTNLTTRTNNISKETSSIELQKNKKTPKEIIANYKETLKIKPNVPDNN